MEKIEKEIIEKEIIEKEIIEKEKIEKEIKLVREKEIKLVRDFVFEKIDKDKVMVLGTDEMIDKFSSSFGVNVYVVMIDFNGQYDNIEAKPIHVYNGRTKEINILGMANKKEVIKIIKVFMKKDFEDEDIIKDLILIELVKSKDKFGIDKYDVNTQIARTEKDKMEIVNKILKSPGDDIRKDIETIVSKEKKERIKYEEQYIGYV